MSRVLVAILGLLVFGARPAAAQYRFAPDYLPLRELGVNVSGWLMKESDQAVAATGIYTRNLLPLVAVEGGADVGSAVNRPFAHTFLQMRLMTGGYQHPGGFITVGVARGFADRDHRSAPRGSGWLIGFGVRQPVNVANRMAIRLEGQLGRYRDDRVALRVLLGFAASLD